MCAALYHPVTGAIAAWGEFKFPYDRDVRAPYQGNREYLGHLFSIIVLIAHTPAHTTTRQYFWINDNTGALQWSAAQKCSSMASNYANLAVAKLHTIARRRMVPPVHKPGIEMGDIDTMSRLAAHKNPTEKEIQQRCSTLTPFTMLILPHAQLRKLFLLLDPHLTHPSTHDHHDAFIQVYRTLNELIDALSP